MEQIHNFTFHETITSLLKICLIICFQWREASYTAGGSGNVQRVYTVCNVDSPNVNNWVRTPFLPRQNGADRYFVNMVFSVRKCTKFPDPANLQQCREVFKLMYQEAGSDVANSTYPSWTESSYNLVDTIAASNLFTDSSNVLLNNETRSIRVTQDGVYLTFFDQGSCTTLLSVKVYYVVCPQLISNFAIFAQTVTGPELTSVVKTNGTCVANAQSDSEVSYLCKADGYWFPYTGTCSCIAGYQPNSIINNTCSGKY